MTLLNFTLKEIMSVKKYESNIVDTSRVKKDHCTI